MGSMQDYRCTNCGYEATASEDFAFGFTGEVITPVVCATHGLVIGETGLNAQQRGWKSKRRKSYPCSVCGRSSARWDRRTCPACGQPTMDVNPEGGITMWD